MSNNRTKLILARTFNAIAVGGQVSATIAAGYDATMRSSPDGLQLPIIERAAQFVRGSMTYQDWLHAIDLLTATVGTDVFYERKSGVSEAAGYIKHTLTNPIVYRARISQKQDQFITGSNDFECRFTDATKAWYDIWAMTDSKAAPTNITSARGGWRVEEAIYDPSGTPISILSVLGFDFAIEMALSRACNDADLGYTAVDANPEGQMSAKGSITFQDHGIESAKILAVRLLAAGRKPLRIKVKSSEGATSKTITIAGVTFGSGTQSLQSDASAYNSTTLDYEVSNAAATPLTLTGTNKIIEIADAA